MNRIYDDEDDADDAEMSAAERSLERARALLEQHEAERPQREADMAARQEAIKRGDIREWQLPEPEPQTRERTARRTTTSERSAMSTSEWSAFISMTVRNEVARALTACKKETADAIGKVIVEERRRFEKRYAELAARIVPVEEHVKAQNFYKDLAGHVQTLQQRAEPDDGAAVLDLGVERSRRDRTA
jgi:hypothetical protein